MNPYEKELDRIEELHDEMYVIKEQCMKKDPETG